MKKNKKVLVSSMPLNKIDKISKKVYQYFEDDDGNVDYDSLDNFLTRNSEKIKQMKDTLDERKIVYCIKELYPAYFGEIAHALSLIPSTLHYKIKRLIEKQIVKNLDLLNDNVLHKRNYLKKIIGQTPKQFYMVNSEFERYDYSEFTKPISKQFKNIIICKQKELLKAEIRYGDVQSFNALSLKEREEKKQPIIIQLKAILERYSGPINYRMIQKISLEHLQKEITPKKARYYLQYFQYDGLVIQTESGLVIRKVDEKEAEVEFDENIRKIIPKNE